jgi:bacillithiol biosynthesis cysteine-adding enzyme BshC
LVHRLFSDYGLLFIDGDEKILKNEMKSVFKNEILFGELFESTENTVDFLSSKYGKVQVNPRKINLFYLSKTRNRIDFDGEKYKITDTEMSFTKDEILQEIEKNPEKFSPNVLIRPVYQETILPNIAYIGGNAEIMYWLELKNYFEKIKLPFPVLIPRSSMLFISEKTLNKIEKTGFEINDFFKNFERIIESYLLGNNKIKPFLGEMEDNFKRYFHDLKMISELTDKTFINLVSAEEIRQLKSFERMRKRLLRAEKIKQSEKLLNIEKLFLKINPENIWQERSYNFSVFYADFGKNWLKKCYEEINVERSELAVLTI